MASVTIDGVEYQYKKIGIGRRARAVYLSQIIAENSPIVLGIEGQTKPTKEEFEKAYKELSNAWGEFVVEVLDGSVEALGDFASVDPQTMTAVSEGFFRAAGKNKSESPAA